MTVSVTVRRMLNLDDDATSTKLDDIEEMVEAQLINRLGGIETVVTVPDELAYIVVNVSLARYNQIGDEGKNASTVEGESSTWLTDLFAPYEEDIQKYLDRNNSTVSGGSITFL